MHRLWSEIHVPLATHASVATNGANARLIQAGPFGRAVRVRGFYWSPTGANNAGNSAASYRRLSLFNGGSAGTGTATANRLGSINLTASVASLGAVAGVVAYPATGTQASLGTVASNEIVYFSQETVGGADATHTALAAGQFHLIVEAIG